MPDNKAMQRSPAPSIDQPREGVGVVFSVAHGGELERLLPATWSLTALSSLVVALRGIHLRLCEAKYLVRVTQ